MTHKEKYRVYCESKPGIALFQNPWWFDAVCGTENWDVVLYEKNGQTIGAWAYPIKRKYNLILINMPMLTLGIGPVITYFPGQKKASMLSHEQQVMEDLIAQLPKFDVFDLYFLPSYSNHIPFHREGFEQSTRYTFRLKDISDLEKVFDDFSSSLRSQIRKAEKQIHIEQGHDLEEFYGVISLTFKRQKKKAPYSFSYLKKVADACKKHGYGEILLAKDTEGNIHAAIYLAWNKDCAWYLAGGADDNFKSSGAYSLLLWEAIKRSSLVSKQFDFCGSMIPSIERFFRGFGGEQVPYFHLKKIRSKALKFVLAMRG